MNYIFLDIDGVLNSNEFIMKHVDDDVILDEDAIKLLSNLVNVTHAKVVLSSSWRIYFTEDGNPKDNSFTKRGYKLKELLTKFNIEIIGITKTGIGKHGNVYDEGNRYDEIVDYIDKNLKENDNYVIIDDDDFYGSLHQFKDKFIQTSFWKGLTEEHIKKGMKVLNGN